VPWSVRTIVNLAVEGGKHPYPTLEGALARMVE
jgi:hypothetical protein